VGRWIKALRERENSETAQAGGDKTDKTQLGEVLSVLAVPSGRVSEQLREGFASFGSAPFAPSQNGSSSSTPPEVAPDDWWAYFDERAAIREFDGNTSRSEAEALAQQDTVTALGPCPSST
jgi:hypothetical protein